MLHALQKFYAKSESVRAYTMLSPALILIFLLMLIPMILMLSFSFFTQIYDLISNKGDSIVYQQSKLELDNINIDNVDKIINKSNLE